MAKIYNVDTNQDIKISNYHVFDSQPFESENSTTYMSVLNIFRKVFTLTDLSFLARKKNDTV